MKQATLTRRSRKFGWGYSTSPSGRDAYHITPPAHPDYEGTVSQVGQARLTDATFNSLDGAFYAERYFLNGRPIKFDDDLDLIFLGDGHVDKITVTFID